MSPTEALGKGWVAAGELLRHNAWRLVLLFVGLLLPLWVFTELADEVHELESFYFDEPMLRFAEALSAPGLDRFFVGVSAAGYEYGVIPFDIALVVVLALCRRWRDAVFAASAFLGSALLNVASKQFFQRDRPTLWESIAPESTYSFPSGHAMGSMTLAMVVILLAWPTRWRWWVFAGATLFTVLVGLSRIYLGVHYPSDILAGWMAGMAWVAGVYLILYRHRWNWRPAHWHRH